MNNKPAHNALFETISTDIHAQGYSIQESALPNSVTQSLWRQLQQGTTGQFKRAGIGRQQHYQHNENIRSDDICWIQEQDASCAEWLSWVAALQSQLNRQLFLGLKSFESHFAHYQAGAFYQKHLDAFKGQSNRVLSLVVYLNPDWHRRDGGELVLYVGPEKTHTLTVLPRWGSVVVFLSEEFPHEVCPATRDRYSVAGWFRS